MWALRVLSPSRIPPRILMSSVITTKTLFFWWGKEQIRIADNRYIHFYRYIAKKKQKESIVRNKCSYLAFISGTAVNYKCFSKLPKPAWRWSQCHFPKGWLTDCLKTNSFCKYQNANKFSSLVQLQQSQVVSEEGSSCPSLALAHCLGLHFPTSVLSEPGVWQSLYPVPSMHTRGCLGS